MQLYFIRHGQSSNNALYEATSSDNGRSEDAPLTPIGIQQANALAGYLTENYTNKTITSRNLHNQNGYFFTHLYTSPMVRAAATATAIAEALGLPLSCWIDIHEEGGIFLKDPASGALNGLPGKDRRYFQQHYPKLLLPDDFNEAGWWNRSFETYAERPPRARRVLERLLAAHGGSDDCVVWVSHGGFYNHFVDAVLGLYGEDAVYFRLFNTGITRIDFEAERTVLAYQNRISHLPAELITD